MNVELPSTGCNILQSDNLIYNYSNNNRTRREYAIYEGKLYLRNETTSNYDLSHNGTCLSTGDLVYKPELKGVWFPIVAFVMFFGIVIFVFRLFRGRV